MQNEIRVLALGDVIGKPGRKALEQFIGKVSADFKIVNGENLAGGIGITPSVAMEVLDYGVDVITTGNHVWKKREIQPYLMAERRVIRPLNYPSGTPGFGSTVVEKNGKRICVANIQGLIFMDPIMCPFRAMETFLEQARENVPIVVDFHAEATSEKIAMGWFLDGRVSVLYGTHTHVQTADNRVLPKGTGYITDLGMTGPADSVIGMDKMNVLERFVTQLPHKFEVAKGDVEIQGVLATIESATGKCISVERIKQKVD
jgi:2',3'-cyclic-nucleotide 2'-phosphodiesterase